MTASVQESKEIHLTPSLVGKLGRFTYEYVCTEAKKHPYYAMALVSCCLSFYSSYLNYGFMGFCAAHKLGFFKNTNAHGFIDLVKNTTIGIRSSISTAASLATAILMGKCCVDALSLVVNRYTLTPAILTGKGLFLAANRYTFALAALIGAYSLWRVRNNFWKVIKNEDGGLKELGKKITGGFGIVKKPLGFLFKATLQLGELLLFGREPALQPLTQFRKQLDQLATHLDTFNPQLQDQINQIKVQLNILKEQLSQPDQIGKNLCSQLGEKIVQLGEQIFQLDAQNANVSHFQKQLGCLITHFTTLKGQNNNNVHLQLPFTQILDQLRLLQACSQIGGPIFFQAGEEIIQLAKEIITKGGQPNDNSKLFEQLLSFGTFLKALGVQPDDKLMTQLITQINNILPNGLQNNALPGVAHPHSDQLKNLGMLFQGWGEQPNNGALLDQLMDQIGKITGDPITHQAPQDEGFIDTAFNFVFSLDLPWKKHATIAAACVGLIFLDGWLYNQASFKLSGLLALAPLVSFADSLPNKCKEIWKKFIENSMLRRLSVSKCIILATAGYGICNQWNISSLLGATIFGYVAWKFAYHRYVHFVNRTTE